MISAMGREAKISSYLSTGVYCSDVLVFILQHFVPEFLYMYAFRITFKNYKIIAKQNYNSNFA